jgi:hypothetical protein
MTHDEQYPERGYNTKDVEALRSNDAPKKGFARRHWGKLLLSAIVFVPVLTIALWTIIALSFSYSSGEQVGYVQKFAKKGWLCKTYEGQIAMVNLPGQIAKTFDFSVRDDSVADLINKYQGKQVGLAFKQHKGIPTSCFGETEYFVSGVRVLSQ